MTEKSRSERGGRRRFNLKRREACTGWLFVSPALIGFSIFTFGSILYSLYLSFTDYNLLSKPNWLGLQNYVKAFTDDQYFYPYFGNTFYFVVALVPIVLVVSLLLAILAVLGLIWVIPREPMAFAVVASLCPLASVILMYKAQHDNESYLKPQEFVVSDEGVSRAKEGQAWVETTTSCTSASGDSP